jgi:hypothetical protein
MSASTSAQHIVAEARTPCTCTSTVMHARKQHTVRSMQSNAPAPCTRTVGMHSESRTRTRSVSVKHTRCTIRGAHAHKQSTRAQHAIKQAHTHPADAHAQASMRTGKHTGAIINISRTQEPAHAQVHAHIRIPNKHAQLHHQNKGKPLPHVHAWKGQHMLTQGHMRQRHLLAY